MGKKKKKNQKSDEMSRTPQVVEEEFHRLRHRWEDEVDEIWDEMTEEFARKYCLTEDQLDNLNDNL